MLSVDQWGESHVAALSPYLLWNISSRRDFNAYRQDTGLPGISAVSYTHLDVYKRQEEEPADEVAPAGEEKSAEEGNSAQPPAAEDEEKKRAEHRCV